METLIQLGSVKLTIPAWQLALFIGMFSLLMVLRQIKFCLLTTYGFTLYWGYFLYGPVFFGLSSTNPDMMTVYIITGLVVAAFTLIAFFYEEK